LSFLFRVHPDSGPEFFRRIKSMTICKSIVALGLVVASWTITAGLANAQSTALSSPTAIRSNEVTAAIAARDLGDSRLTDHFFAFTGTPGDLLITVESRNLNGDIDVFTAAGMRPLLKFTVYEGRGSAVTKSIYLRKREDLILRVEARTPNDDDGVYRLRFGGSFEPISGGLDAGELAATDSPSLDTEGKSGKKGRRVSSVGARIDEPAPAEVAAAPTPEPEVTEKPEAAATTPRTTSRNTRGRRPVRGRTRPAIEVPAGEKPVPETREETIAAERATVEKPATEPRSTTGRRRAGRRGTPRAVEKPASPPVEESGPRLIIETNDGTMINRYMTSVRRVTVENGRVVVVGKDGKVETFQLASIVKMSVEP